MTQNIYDDEGFYGAYGQLPRSRKGLDGAPEWPSLRAMLPDMANLKVLDLGCGYGWFCRWARERGARNVVGIDVSERMLARAMAGAADPAIRYVRADLERYEPPPDAFDVVYSSLALHYIVDIERLLAAVHRALVPGGILVFSMEHPMFTAPMNPGWSKDETDRRTWPVSAYLEEGPRSTDWLTKRVIKQHRTMATLINLLLRLGFALSRVEEWGPTAAQIEAQPDLAEVRERPPFLLVAARRRKPTPAQSPMKT
jgi:SAM-dependent methyltransferase